MYQPLAFVQNFSLPEIAILGLVVVLFFGAKRLPELFGSMGKSIKEFKKGMQEDFVEPTPVPVPVENRRIEEGPKSV